MPSWLLGTQWRWLHFNCCHHRRIGGRPASVVYVRRVLSAMGAPAEICSSTSRPARCLRADAQRLASDFTIRTSLFTRSLSTCVWLYPCIQRMHVGGHSCMYACAHVLHTPLCHGVLMHEHNVPVLRMCVLYISFIGIRKLLLCACLCRSRLRGCSGSREAWARGSSRGAWARSSRARHPACNGLVPVNAGCRHSRASPDRAGSAGA